MALNIKRDFKQILLEAPSNSITLGELELSFPKLKTEDFLKAVLKTTDLRIARKWNEFILATAHPTKTSKYIRSVTINILKDYNWEYVSALLQNYCIWVVDKVKDILKGALKIKILTHLNHMPIYGAGSLVLIFFNRNYTDTPCNRDNNENRIYPDEFFKEVKQFQKNFLKYNDNRNVQHKNLLSTLRPYQIRAVQWMISRERDEFQMQNNDWIRDSITELVSKCGTKLSYCHNSEVLTSKLYAAPKSFRGGILADEMGLGKTVDVLALILSNPREISEELDNDEFLICETDNVDLNRKRALKDTSSKPNKKRKRENFVEDIEVKSIKCLCKDREFERVEDWVQCPACLFYQHKKCCHYEENRLYFCTSCWEEQKLVKSSATLIIVPESICDQWKEEIKKHVDQSAWGKGVFVYTDFESNGFVQPSVLASYRIVLTTYEVLAKEFFYVPPRRKNSNFLKKISPILRIQWWRLCLDEAQAVKEDEDEDGVLIGVKIARSIIAVNQWNVTGTPIRGSIKDLQDLTHWIEAGTPFDNIFWENCLISPLERGKKTPILSVLSQIFWRNSKEDVADECPIPPQRTILHSLKFTPIELSFYMREHAAVLDQFEEKLRRLGLYDLDKTLDSLNTNTLKQVLAPLLSLRQACSHHLAVRDSEISNQLDQYNKGKKGTNMYLTLEDLLQYLQKKTEKECEESLKNHLVSMYDLAGIHCVLKDWPGAVDHYQKALTVTEEYGKKLNVTVVPSNVRHITEIFDKILKDHPEGFPTTLRDKELGKIAQDLEIRYLKKNRERYDTSSKLLKTVTKKVVSLNVRLLNVISDSWAVLISSLSENEIVENVTDQLSERNLENNVFLAKIAGSVEETLNNWWVNLITSRTELFVCLNKLLKTDVDDYVNKADSCHIEERVMRVMREVCDLCVCGSLLTEYEGFVITESHDIEILLKVILQLSDDNTENQGCVRKCKQHVKLLTEMKKEFKQIRLVVQNLGDLVTETAKLKSLKTRSDFQKKSQSTLSQLKKKYGTLLYLRNLNQIDDSDRDPCSICFQFFEKEWCVLQCGHFFCIDCTARLKDQRKRLTCAICREVTSASNVGLVHLNQDTRISDQEPVHYSTKVDAIIKTLSDLKESDPDVKVLIFSTWDIVLKVLEQALSVCGISYRLMSGKNFLKQIKEFKNPDLNVTALLLPVSNGCKGLNLTEASHVFFIEPLLNPDEELQAIARVHRMGQTKETVVHKFLIDDTIEEKINGAVSYAKNKWAGQRNVTLGDLRNLFEIDSVNEYRRREELVQDLERDYHDGKSESESD